MEAHLAVGGLDTREETWGQKPGTDIEYFRETIVKSNIKFHTESKIEMTRKWIYSSG